MVRLLSSGKAIIHYYYSLVNHVNQAMFTNTVNIIYRKINSINYLLGQTALVYILSPEVSLIQGIKCKVRRERQMSEQTKLTSYWQKKLLKELCDKIVSEDFLMLKYCPNR